MRASLDHPAMPWSVAFSPDGSLLAAAGFENAGGRGPSWIRLWETATWAKRSTFEIPEVRVHRIAFAPDGKSMIAAGLDRASLLTCEVATGKCRILFENNESGGLQSRPVASPDGSVIATAGPEGAMLWDASRWDKIQVLGWTRDRDLTLGAVPADNWRIQGGWLYAMDGYGIVSCIVPGGVTPPIELAGVRYPGPPLWRLNRVRGVARPWTASHLALAPDGKTAAFIATEEDQSARIDLYQIENSDSWRKRSSINLDRDKADFLYCLAFTPDGRALVAGCGDRLVRLWEVAGGRELPTLQGHIGAISGLAFSADGTMMATADTQGRSVRVWSPRAS
jgi:WD40 repeat protein